MFTDGSRLGDGTVGYAVAEWTSLGGYQDPHGQQPRSIRRGVCRIARSLETAARRQPVPKRVTIFTDAQAAIRRMASEEPGPGQMYAIQARKQIAALKEPGQTSPSRYGGALRTGASPGTRSPTSGRSSRQKNRTRAARSSSQGLSRTSSGISRRRNGVRPDNGLGAVSPARSTRCRESSNLTRRWPGAPRGTPRGPTS
jgi:hypothetical protein